MPSDAATRRRRPGRPPKASARREVLEVAVNLIVDRGYARMTMEDVASAARLSRATIYRQWASKRELMIDALLTRGIDTPLPQAPFASAREALTEAAQGFVASTDSLLGRAFPAVIAEAVRDREFGELFQQVIIEPRHRELEAIVRSGIESGELQPDLVPADVVDAVFGALYYRLTVTRAVNSADSAAAIVNLVLDGAS